MRYVLHDLKQQALKWFSFVLDFVERFYFENKRRYSEDMRPAHAGFRSAKENRFIENIVELTVVIVWKLKTNVAFTYLIENLCSRSWEQCQVMHDKFIVETIIFSLNLNPCN